MMFLYRKVRMKKSKPPTRIYIYRTACMTMPKNGMVFIMFQYWMAGSILFIKRLESFALSQVVHYMLWPKGPSLTTLMFFRKDSKAGSLHLIARPSCAAAASNHSCVTNNLGADGKGFREKFGFGQWWLPWVA